MKNIQVLDGRKVRDVLLLELMEKYQKLTESLHLIVIKIGNYQENELYIRQKEKMANFFKVRLTVLAFSEFESQSIILKKIEELNLNPKIHGIMIQSPIPKHFSFLELIDAVDPIKDVDGLTSFHQQSLFKQSMILPGCVRGIFELLKFYQLVPNRQNVVILGKSRLVGLPLAKLLEKNNQVILCDSKTPDIVRKIKEADYIFIAIGKPFWLKKEMIKQGVIIIDIGTTIVDGKLYGDCDFLDVLNQVGAITPVPGGVGPLTVVGLFENLMDLYQIQHQE